MGWALNGLVATYLRAHVGASLVVVLLRPFFAHDEAIRRLAEF